MDLNPLISKPKTGSAGRTGNWRVFKPVIDRDSCSKCGLCVMYCPEDVVSEEIEINYEYCKGCGICYNICPQKAVSLVEE